MKRCFTDHNYVLKDIDDEEGSVGLNEIEPLENKKNKEIGSNKRKRKFLEMIQQALYCMNLRVCEIKYKMDVKFTE